MVDVRLKPLPAADLAAWREQREAAGDPLPVPQPGDGYDALELVVDDVAVGGVVLTLAEDGPLLRCSIRELQTTLSPDDAPRWAAVIAGLEARARDLGADTLVTSVGLDLTVPFSDAGFRASMTMHRKRLDPAALEMQDDRRVALRPMTADERAAWADDTRRVVRRGAARAGVADAGAAPGPVEHRLAALADGPVPDGEVLLVGTLDGVPVGRCWGTLGRTDGGDLTFSGNTLDLLAGHRDRGLTGSFLGALRRHLDELGVRELRVRVHGHQAGVRRLFLRQGVGVHRALLRKDL